MLIGLIGLGGPGRGNARYWVLCIWSVIYMTRSCTAQLNSWFTNVVYVSACLTYSCMTTCMTTTTISENLTFPNKTSLHAAFNLQDVCVQRIVNWPILQYNICSPKDRIKKCCRHTVLAKNLLSETLHWYIVFHFTFFCHFEHCLDPDVCTSEVTFLVHGLAL
jgi:hypothetical protein